MDLEIEGDLPDFMKDPSGNTLKKEAVELWYRNPVELVEELLGNPMFKDVKYAPEHIYEDKEGKVEVIDEMWTAKWWWEIQVCAQALKKPERSLMHIRNSY